MTTLERVKTKEELDEKLSGYYGTEQYHVTNPFIPIMRVTDGVVAFAELTGGYWFIDEIGLRLRKIWNKDRYNLFAIVFLKVKNDKATVDIYSDYNSDLTKAENKKYRLCGFSIDFTDMVEGTHKFYLQRDVSTYKTVCLLPSEY